MTSLIVHITSSPDIPTNAPSSETVASLPGRLNESEALPTSFLYLLIFYIMDWYIDLQIEKQYKKHSVVYLLDINKFKKD